MLICGLGSIFFKIKLFYSILLLKNADFSLLNALKQFLFLQLCLCNEPLILTVYIKLRGRINILNPEMGNSLIFSFHIQHETQSKLLSYIWIEVIAMEHFHI